jgi:hypothetical protein
MCIRFEFLFHFIIFFSPFFLNIYIYIYKVLSGYLDYNGLQGLMSFENAEGVRKELEKDVGIIQTELRKGKTKLKQLMDASSKHQTLPAESDVAQVCSDILDLNVVIGTL